MLFVQRDKLHHSNENKGSYQFHQSNKRAVLPFCSGMRVWSIHRLCSAAQHSACQSTPAALCTDPAAVKSQSVQQPANERTQ